MSRHARRKTMIIPSEGKGEELSDPKGRRVLCPIKDFTVSPPSTRTPSHPAHFGQGHTPRPQAPRPSPVRNGARGRGKVEVGNQAGRTLL
jgi:hypothetical protein